MKKLADKSRTEREFVTGDMVLLKLQPCRQISVGGKKPKKLSSLFYGSYRAMQRVRSVVYKLELLAGVEFTLCFMYLNSRRNWGRLYKCNIRCPLTH